MSKDLTIDRTPEAVESPLLIHSILESGVRSAPDQEIVYADQRRLTYRELEQRVHRLAGALAAQGVKPGDTVAVMDWDTHRYLEAFFAIPMMGAVLHTVNVRLSPEQILYTLNHAEDDVILVNREFLPVLEELKDRIETAKTFILLDDEGGNLDSKLDLAGEYEALLQQAPDQYDFPLLDENTRATTFYTTGTPACPRACISPTASWCCTPSPAARRCPVPAMAGSTRTTSTCRSRPCSTCTPGACPTWPPCWA